MESYSEKNMSEDFKYTVKLIQTSENPIKIKSINNNSVLIINKDKKNLCLPIKDEDDYLDSKQSTYHIEKPINHTKYTNKKIRLDEKWTVIVRSQCIKVNNGRGRLCHKKVHGKIIYMNALNTNTLIVITKKRRESLVNCIILRWENNVLSEKISLKNISSENRFYTLTAEKFIHVQPRTDGFLLHLYDAESLIVTDTFPYAKKMSCIKMLPDNKTLVFYPILTNDNASTLNLLNTQTRTIKEIDMDKKIIDFNILPNGKIVVLVLGGNIMQIDLDHIRELRIKNTSLLKNKITETTPAMNGAPAAIIASYLNVHDYYLNKNILFNQPNRVVHLYTDDKKFYGEKINDRLKSRL